MKKYLMFLVAALGLFFIFPKTSGAQGVFAPIGAEWYHNVGYGVFHSVVTEDTVFMGIDCRHISVVARRANPAQSPYIYGYNFYVYNNADTVFIYNHFFNRFTPLYVFNVQAGDTLRLPVIQTYHCLYLNSFGTDSTFSIIIDSVINKQWGNDTLKTVYSHPLDLDSPAYAMHQLPYFCYCTFEGSDTEGVYVQKLGGPSSGFLPYCGSCAGLLDESCQPMLAMRCYHEPDSAGGVSVTLVADSCDAGIPPNTGIVVPGDNYSLIIYPNPAQNKLHIFSAGTTMKSVSITIYDELGRKILSYTNLELRDSPLSMDISTLQPGVYFVVVSNNNGFYEKHKFVKVGK